MDTPCVNLVYFAVRSEQKEHRTHRLDLDLESYNLNTAVIPLYLCYAQEAYKLSRSIKIKIKIIDNISNIMSKFCDIFYTKSSTYLSDQCQPREYITTEPTLIPPIKI
jgi:hypothetical protein